MSNIIGLGFGIKNYPQSGYFSVFAAYDYKGNVCFPRISTQQIDEGRINGKQIIFEVNLSGKQIDNIKDCLSDIDYGFIQLCNPNREILKQWDLDCLNVQILKEGTYKSIIKINYVEAYLQ